MLNKTILIVEDEPDLLDLLTELLEMESYTIFRASSGEEALEIWKKSSDKIDLLLTDLTLPRGMTGIELAKNFQQQKPSLKILYSSGHTAEMLIKKYALPENSHFLQKPFQPNVLGKVIQNVFDA
jgi:two-component system cell cycle sensor histidine kinase/response regulator CckA